MEPPYVAAISALTPLASGHYESPAPAIIQNERPLIEHVIAAKKQLKSRETLSLEHPQRITDQELVAAEKRYHKIKAAQFDLVGPNGDPIRAWGQLIIERMDANMQQIDNRFVRLERSMRTMRREIRREIRRESQRMMNRSVRTNTERLVPVLRMEDGHVPEHFPRTTEDFCKATGRQLDALLRFYNLPQPRALAAKKRSLQEHLGLNL